MDSSLFLSEIPQQVKEAAMTAIATKPIQVVIPSGNGSTPPQETAATPPLATAHLDQALAVLQAHKDAWVATGVAERIALLADIRQRMAAVGERWVGAILDAKGTHRAMPSVWARNGPTTPWRCAGCGSCSAPCKTFKRHGRPQLPGRLTTRSDGQVVVRIFPQTLFDRMLFMGVTGEVWMQPGITAADVPAQPGICLSGQGPSRPGGAGPGRRQRRVHAARRPAAPALHRRPRRAAQAQPGQRLPGAAAGGGVAAAGAARLPAHRRPAARPRAPICALTRPWTPST